MTMGDFSLNRSNRVRLSRFLKGKDVVLDLYCGMGTIALQAARKASKVYGVETAKQAVLSAREACGINDIKNAVFSQNTLIRHSSIPQVESLLIK